MLRAPIRRAWSAVTEPKRSMDELDGTTLETMLGDYCKLLLASGALAGLTAFVVAFVRSFYLDVVRNVHIEYFNLANYYAGIATGIFFFYLFAGTFLFFLLTLVVWAANRPVEYTRIVKAASLGMSPILLFGWIDGAFASSLLLWSAIILVIGVRAARSARKGIRNEDAKEGSAARKGRLRKPSRKR